MSTSPVSAQPRQLTDTQLGPVLARAADWVASFAAAFSAVVAEEHYEQRESGSAGSSARATRSDFLLIRSAGSGAWLPFRDVFEVNGRPVRDRSERLQNLFLTTPATALNDAARINAESSRYNLGAVIRTINVPTFALITLDPDYVGRFAFKKLGEERVGDQPAWRIEFTERARRTIVRTLRGDDVRIEGTLWLAPQSGRVMKTLVKTEGTQDPGRPIPPPSGATLMWVMVTYAPNAVLGMWVPETMTEWAMAANRAAVTGSATYSHFRRFAVWTSETFTPKVR